MNHYQNFRFHALLVCMSIVGSMVLLPVESARAYFITFGSPSAVAETDGSFKSPTVVGNQRHVHNSSVLRDGSGKVNGLSLGALTEASAGGANVGDQNIQSFIDLVTITFTINRSRLDEPMNPRAKLSAALAGTLTAIDAGPGVEAGVAGGVQVRLGLIPILVVDFPFLVSNNRNNVAVNKKGEDTARLLVDTEYTLRLDLGTLASTLWDGTNATSAKSDFEKSLIGRIAVVPGPATLPMFGIGLAGLILAGRARRRRVFASVAYPSRLS